MRCDSLICMVLVGSQGYGIAVAEHRREGMGMKSSLVVVTVGGLLMSGCGHSGVMTPALKRIAYWTHHRWHGAEHRCSHGQGCGDARPVCRDTVISQHVTSQACWYRHGDCWDAESLADHQYRADLNRRRLCGAFGIPPREPMPRTRMMCEKLKRTAKSEWRRQSARCVQG
jgi:hypothetical protein